MGDLYPAFLSLAEREALVVGGGAVALRKVFPLLRAGARGTVVAPEVLADLRYAVYNECQRNEEDSLAQDTGLC